MNNPKVFCSKCHKVHSNPVIDLFNAFASHAFAGANLPADQELAVYRAYMAGQHDALAAMLKITEYPEQAAEGILSNYAAAVRDALLAGIPSGNEVLRAQVNKAVSERFAISQDHGCGGWQYGN